MNDLDLRFRQSAFEGPSMTAETRRYRLGVEKEGRARVGSGSSSPVVSRFVGLGGFGHHESDAADIADDSGTPARLELVPEAAHVHLQEVGLGLEVDSKG